MTISLTHGLIERSIVRHAIATLLTAGYALSLNDDAFGSADFAVVKATTFDPLWKAAFETDDMALVAYAPDGHRVGFVAFIYGNGIDVIHDYSSSQQMDLALKPTLDFVTRLEAHPEQFQITEDTGPDTPAEVLARHRKAATVTT